MTKANLPRHPRPVIDNFSINMYKSDMELVADASAFLAVALNESDREWVIAQTSGYGIVAPEVLDYEIGNALIAVWKKRRLDGRQILEAFDISQKINVRRVPVNIAKAIKMATKFNIYAYDAYYLQCCLENKLPLISLDARMCDVAKNLGLRVLE